jgi:hypothetical protein
MEIVSALISRIEFLTRQNSELSRRLEFYREGYIRGTESKRRRARG